MLYKILQYFVIFFFSANFAVATAWQQQPYSKIRIIGAYEQNQEIILALEIKIDKDWHIYGPNPSDFGIVTSINFSDPNFNISKYYWPKTLKKIEFANSEVEIYQHQVIIPFAIPSQDKIANSFKVSYAICGASCIPVNTTIIYDFNQLPEHIKLIKQELQNQQPQVSVLLMVLCAFVGGFILNFMPCVLPVLSIKLLAFIKLGKQEKKQLKKSFYAIAAGNMVSFLLLGIVLCSFNKVGKAIGFGLHFQHPVFIITMIIITSLFAANLGGAFEINIPARMLNLKFFDKKYHYLFLNFLTGMFATILATPCTAPFVATALAFAFSQNSLEIMLIFSAMGLGFGMPYIIFAIFPSLIHIFPKPGAWMLKCKKILGYLLYLTAMWLLFILAQQLSFLSALLLFGLMMLIKFSLSKKSIIFTSLLIVLSYYIPLHQNLVEKQYQHILAQNANEIWQPFEPEKIPTLLASSKIVLVTVTADWCLTCKVNEYLVFRHPQIQKFLKNSQIYAMKADITKANPEALSYMQKFHKHGIPFNVVYGPKTKEGITLSEILNKKSLINSIISAGLILY
jgi:suppressor for copper-sensitivity B